MSKIITGDLRPILHSLPRPLVMTNGVFDILHRGHVAYLHAARACGASLLVAVNSDASARRLDKGSNRPVNRAEDRMAVLAGLESVDAVVKFGYDDASAVMDLVHPDIYVKGGDYADRETPEVKMARKLGVQVQYVPFKAGYSTTEILARAAQPMRRRAAFLDRDGTIIVDRGYVHQISDLEFRAGAIDGLCILRRCGYEIVIVSNQSGIARGKFIEAQWEIFDAYLRRCLNDYGVEVLDSMMCPHHPEGTIPAYTKECSCRKPKPGMLIEAARRHGIQLADSIMIGDRFTDLDAGEAAGVRECFAVTESTSLKDIALRLQAQEQASAQ